MLYKVMELGTDGWGINDPHRDRNLTKEQAKRDSNIISMRESLLQDLKQLLNKNPIGAFSPRPTAKNL